VGEIERVEVDGIEKRGLMIDSSGVEGVHEEREGWGNDRRCVMCVRCCKVKGVFICLFTSRFFCYSLHFFCYFMLSEH
jgi:hypothetical protein